MLKLSAFIVPHPPIIIPEIGHGEEQKITLTTKAYHQIAQKINALKPDTIIIISPHAKAYSDCFYIPLSLTSEGSLKDFGAPDLRFKMTNNQDFIRHLIRYSNELNNDIYSHQIQVDHLDHGTMVPLYFINQYYTNYQLVKIPLSGLSNERHYQLGKAIQKVIINHSQNVVIIASGDLSHKLKTTGPYGFAKEGLLFDQEITKAMKLGDFLKFLTLDEELCSNAAECGRRSFIMMSGIFDGYDVSSELLSYEGPFGVGYAVAEFHSIAQNNTRQFLPQYNQAVVDLALKHKNQEDHFVKLARESLEYYVLHNKPMKLPDQLPQELLQQKAGVFVSLKIAGELRGCIGTTGPTTLNVATEIIQNAISAGTKDPRFMPVTQSELNKITYSVDVLGPIEPVHSLKDLDKDRYGVIVQHQYKSGLLLPHLEGVDSTEEQIQIALRKANINPNDSYTISRFEVIRHH